MENDNVHVKAVSSQVMELKDLISAPLVATIEADSISSRTYLDYLFEIAFESYNRETGEVGQVRTLSFTYACNDVNGKRVQRVSIPLLTLVPLPLLQVKEADFDFDIQILDAVSESYEEQFSLKEGDVIVPERSEVARGMKLRASLAPSSGAASAEGQLQHSLSANMKVKVKMRQADMPGGLSNLLHLTTNNMQVEDVDSGEE